MQERLLQLRYYLSKPVDGASLAAFRVFFGLAVAYSMLKWLLPEQRRTYLQVHFVDVGWTFPYPGFEWVEPLPSPALEAWFLIAGLAGMTLAAGLLYRASAILVFIGYTYFFLLDAALFNNHYYLICLLAFLVIWMPADRRFALDNLLRRRPARPAGPATVPVWTVFLLRSQLFVVYFFGGIAKINADWLTGEPMYASGLAAHELMSKVISLPVWFLPIHLSQAIAWIGLVFDLSIGFLLLIPRSRLLALALMAIFHGINHLLLPIGVFPFLAFTASLIFLEPDWPVRLSALLRSPRIPRPDWAWLGWGALLVPGLGALLGWRLPASRPAPTPSPPPIGGTRLAFVLIWIGIQVLLPFRHFLIAGDPSWTEEGQYFAWRMMLRQKAAGHLTLHLEDPGVHRPGPGGKPAIDWSALPEAKSKAVFLPIDSHRLDWSGHQGLNTVFGGLDGYRVLYAVETPGDEELEKARIRLRDLWRKRTGEDTEAPETLSLEAVLDRTAAALEGAVDASDLYPAVRSSIETARSLAARTDEASRNDRDQIHATIHDYLAGALETEYGELIRAELGLLHPFALKGAKYPRQRFLVLAHLESPEELQSLSERLGSAESYGVWADFSRLRFFEWRNLPQWFPVAEGDELPIMWNYFRELNLRQTEQLAVRPLMIRQYARRIADRWEERSGRRPKVHGYTNVMMNYRHPRPLLSPAVDLASVEYSFLRHNEWILPLESERIGISK